MREVQSVGNSGQGHSGDATTAFDRLERAKIDEEYAEVNALIAYLSSILADPQKVLQVIMDELNEIKERYGDERRTEIVASSEDINIEDMIVEEDVVVTISHSGYIKRTR